MLNESPLARRLRLSQPGYDAAHNLAKALGWQYDLFSFAETAPADMRAEAEAYTPAGFDTPEAYDAFRWSLGF